MLVEIIKFYNNCIIDGIPRYDFAPGKGSILMDEVHCYGNEQFITDCIHITNHNCVHNEDAGVTCYSTTASGMLYLLYIVCLINSTNHIKGMLSPLYIYFCALN